MTFYYDITRLLAKVDNTTPSGIDRVDIRYAKSIVDSKNKVYFVSIVKGIFCAVDNDYGINVINYLYNKWILNNSIRFSKKDIKPSMFDVGFRCDCKFYKIVDRKLFNLLSNSHGGVYINTSHYGVGKVEAYYVFKVLGNLKIVFFLHDLIPIDFPEYVNDGDKDQHIIRVRAMALFSDLIIVNSVYTEKRLYDFCDKIGISYPKCIVNKIGIEDKFLSGNTYNNKIISGDYFVYVSTIEARKNHIMLLNIWRDMVVTKEKNIPKLVFIGKTGWKNSSSIDMIRNCESIKEYIVHLEGVQDDNLINIVKNAKGFLFPSFVEGWGMPLVEAIALKTPIICSDIEVFHEAGQDLITYISPIDGISWKNEILHITNCNEYRNKKIENFRDYIMPTWERHFNIFYDVIKKIQCTPCRGVDEKTVDRFKASLVGII